jgi:hypothetical protein
MCPQSPRVRSRVHPVPGPPIPSHPTPPSTPIPSTPNRFTMVAREHQGLPERHGGGSMGVRGACPLHTRAPTRRGALGAGCTLGRVCAQKCWLHRLVSLDWSIASGVWNAPGTPPNKTTGASVREPVAYSHAFYDAIHCDNVDDSDDTAATCSKHLCTSFTNPECSCWLHAVHIPARGACVYVG